MIQIKLALNFLPYILITKNLPNNGSSKAMFVWLKPDAPSSTLAQEEVHLVFWYAIAFISFVVASLFLPLVVALILSTTIKPILNTFLKSFNRFEESVSYAVGATHYENPYEYFELLNNSELHQDKYGKRFGDKVKKMYHRLFF